MSRQLQWARNAWGEGMMAKGAGGYYLVMLFAATAFSPGRYVASHRSSYSVEPHYFGTFPLDAQGLEQAKLACQAREDFACRRLGLGA